MVYDLVGSYRTYEEWKRMKFVDIGYILKGSYRTYEEWKQCKIVLRTIYRISSYRTYEEWKLDEAISSFSELDKFLPYL